MTNLPITSNNPQTPTRGTPGGTPLPAPRPSKGGPSGGVPFTGVRNDPSAAYGKAAPTSQANSAANDQTAEPFSVLLARQIGEAGLPALNTTQISATNDSKAATGDVDPTAKDAQDQTTIAASTSSDPANTLAALLLQIPVQQTNVPSGTPVVGTPLHGDPSADRGQSSSSPLIRGAGGIRQRIVNSLQRTSDRSMGTDSALPTTDNRQQTDTSSLIPQFSSITPVPSDAVKHVEIAVSSAGQPQTSQNITKTVTSAAESAVMSNILTSDIPADIPQTITTPLGHSGWADEFSQKIIWMSTQQNQIAELHLNPPDLGPLNVVMKISDNQVTVQFTSPHSAVRDAVENALPKLREILADNNIMLGNATVSDQPPRDRSGEGFTNQGSGTAAQREIPYNATESNGLSPTTEQSVPARRHNGMLDTFA